MPDQGTTYQCPGSTGPLHSDGAAWDTGGLNDDWGADADGLRACTCPGCGAALLCDSTTAAASCPYCGSPTLMPGQLSGKWKPELILPFRLSLEDAVKALKQHYRGRPFLPRCFTAKGHVREICGVYVPFWLYDGAAEGDASFDAARTYTAREGHDEVTRTEHYDVYRAGTVSFEKVPVNASAKFPDGYIDAIEPYDYAELRPFSAACLPGFLADQSNVTAENCATSADVRCAAALTDALRTAVTGYDACTVTAQSCTLRRGRVRYALLPVWMLNTKWKGREYLFAINGQTGRLVGDLPMSWGKFWGLFAAIAAPLVAIGIAMSIWL